MNKTLGNIIKDFREKHGLSMDEFAKMSNLSKGYISMLEKNENPNNKKPITPSLDTYNSVAKALNTTIDALLNIVDSDEPIRLSINQKNNINDIPNIIPITIKKLPLLGEIACGEPIFASEDRESYIEVGTEIKADFCLKCKGDSMINARINDGDIVFIRIQSMVNNGEIAAVIINDEATLKRVYYHQQQGILELRPENSKYKSLIYTKENLNEVKILGKAIAFQADII